MIASLRSGYRFAYRPRGLRQGPGSNTSICRATAYRPIAVANRTMVGDRSWPRPAGGSNIVRGSECGRKAQGMLLYDGLGELYVTVHDAHHPGRSVGRAGVLADDYSLPEP